MSEAPEEPRNGTEPGPGAAAPPWLPAPVQVQRYPSAEALADAAAKRFLDTAKRAVEKFDHFNVVLSGDAPHLGLYRRLTEEPYRGSVPWDRVFFVFADESCVPPDDERSRYRGVRETLFDPLEIHEHRILRMKGEDNPADAARRYEVRLGDLFLIRPKRCFDLALLGVGTDGSTASLFPGSQVLDEEARWVAASRAPGSDERRLTLTLPALNASRRVLFLASGSDKAHVVAEAFGEVAHGPEHPCERVRPSGARREALVDLDAASMMPVPAES